MCRMGGSSSNMTGTRKLTRLRKLVCRMGGSQRPIQLRKPMRSDGGWSVGKRMWFDGFGRPPGLGPCCRNQMTRRLLAGMGMFLRLVINTRRLGWERVEGVTTVHRGSDGADCNSGQRSCDINKRDLHNDQRLEFRDQLQISMCNGWVYICQRAQICNSSKKQVHAMQKLCVHLNL